MADRASKSRPPPPLTPLAQGLDPPLGRMVSDIKRDIPKFGTVFTQTGATYDENTQSKFQLP